LRALGACYRLAARRRGRRRVAGRAGRLRAIAMASLKRTTFAPEVPTLVDAGLPGFEAGVWYGIMAPAGLSADIVTRLHQELTRIVRLPEVRERLAVEGVEPVGNTPAEFRRYLETDLKRIAEIARLAKIEVQD
jgi:tripartite-type tricarboxylate transporter receptor subunit TctC